MSGDPLTPAGDGHTPVPDDDRADLVPTWISTRSELYAAEQANIARATLGLRPTTDALLDDLYLRDLHRRMFTDVWRWAGHYRQREMSIGIDPTTIGAAVRQLVGDTRAWIEFAAYGPDAIAVRFHHQLVSIHPFVNGNGRHARVAADLLAQALGAPRLTWGANLSIETSELRARYLAALRRADANRGDLDELIAFARS